MTRYVLPWGCWDCGSTESRVADSDIDDDGLRVRLRVCLGCGAYWDTEERRISRHAFFGRASKRRKSEQRRRAGAQRTCRLCRGVYRGGTYQRHKSEPIHADEVQRRQERRRERQKLISRRWYIRDVANRRANARTMREQEQAA